MAAAPDTGRTWSMRLNARAGFSAAVHLMHSVAILILTSFVPGAAGFYLRCAWGIAAIFSAIGLLLLMRVGNYDGTTDKEIGGLIQRSYWVATGTYLVLLAVSLYFILQMQHQ